MSQISDAVWTAIRSDNIRNDIRGTTEALYNSIVNRILNKDDHCLSPAESSTNQRYGASIAPALGGGDEDMPPGFGIPVSDATDALGAAANAEPPGSDMPSGSSTSVSRHAAMAHAVGSSSTVTEDEYEPDVPPGFV